jgi:hypothetical protein
MNKLGYFINVSSTRFTLTWRIKGCSLCLIDDAAEDSTWSLHMRKSLRLRLYRVRLSIRNKALDNLDPYIL